MLLTYREFLADLIREKESPPGIGHLFWLCTPETIQQDWITRVDQLFEEWQNRELEAWKGWDAFDPDDNNDEVEW